jgi:hypothetical protein
LNVLAPSPAYFYFRLSPRFLTAALLTKNKTLPSAASGVTPPIHDIVNSSMLQIFIVATVHPAVCGLAGFCVKNEDFGKVISMQDADTYK